MGIAWTAIALALLAWLTAALSSDSIRNFDADVRLGIHQWASPTLTEFAQGITILGSIRSPAESQDSLPRSWDSAARLDSGEMGGGKNRGGQLAASPESRAIGDIA